MCETPPVAPSPAVRNVAPRRGSRVTRHRAAIATLLALATATHGLGARADAGEAVDVAEYRGIVEAAREAEISPLFDGWLTGIRFVPGEYVREGDVLFEFSTGERALLLEMDRARLDRARAELARAEAALGRAERLSAREVIAEAERLEAAIGRDIAAANVREAELRVEMSELVMEFLTLRAPISGIISRPAVLENTYLTKDARQESGLATIAQLDPIWVVAEVPYEVYARRREELETDSEAMAALDLSLVLPDGSVYDHTGRYFSGGYRFDPETGTASVWAEFPNPDHLLRPGLRVTVRSTMAPDEAAGRVAKPD